MTSKTRRVLLAVLLGTAALAGASTLPLFGAVRSDVYRTPGGAAGLALPYRFPRGFLWGTATSAHQIERAQRTDWADFEPAVWARHGDVPAEARERKTDFERLYPQDLGWAAAMRHNAFRFSISWARLFPDAGQTQPDPAGLAYYRDLVATMRRLHLTPFLTLFHWDTPSWFWQPVDGRRGWERPDALAHFGRFVQVIAENFGGDIDHYCTLNEPMVYLYNGYLEGEWPPRERRPGPEALGPVLLQLVRAHALAYRILKEDARRRGKSIEVGLTQHARVFAPYRNWDALDRVAAAQAEKAFVYDLLDALQSGELKLTGTSFRAPVPEARGTQDYVGINYYGRFYIKTDLLHPTRFAVLFHDPARTGEQVDEMGWAADPRGLCLVLREAARRYHLPLYVLENGTADGEDDDRRRQEFLRAHLRELALCQAGGVDVRGYFHWSLLDNFEWTEGFDRHFGLMAVDLRHGFRRLPRASAMLYTRIIVGGLDAELMK